MKMKTLKIFRETGDLRCPGCNWDNTVFYRLGKEPILSKKEQKEGRYANGNCADCFMDLVTKSNDLVVTVKQVAPGRQEF